MALYNHNYFCLIKNSFIVDNQTIKNIVQNCKPDSIPQAIPYPPPIF